MVAPLRQFSQADRPGLVGVQQALVGSCGAVQAGLELLVCRPLAGAACLGRGGNVLELRQQPVGIGEQAGDMVPHGRLKFFGFDVAAWAGRGAGSQDAVFAVALVVAPLRLACRRGIGAAEHGQATTCAGEQAAQEVAVFCVVPERGRGIAGELRLRPVPDVLVDDRRHGDGNPLLARLGLAA